MTDLGSYFRRKREEKQISLESVAEDTHIAIRYLKAIENDAFDQFPAHVYAKGFIRIYARYLDLDAESLITEYTLNVEDEPSPDEPDADGDYSLMYWGLLGLIVLTAVVLVLMRFAWTHPGPARRAYRASEVPEAEVSRGMGDSYTLTPDKHPERLRLRVLARQQTWIYAVFDGRQKREIMLRPGEETTWEAQDTIRLRVDNAGALRMSFQGHRLPPLGPSGHTADRIITLEDERLVVKETGARVSPRTRTGPAH